ncbi:MAG: hypothetical protein H6Q75_1653 [Firmicutes bacterium]|nr:hypothetical protein [Bacillota bacterium]
MTKPEGFSPVYFYEQNSLLPLTPTIPPLTSPFPIYLSTGETLNLALINVPAVPRGWDVLLSSVINWSATFTPPETATTLTIPGYVDATFELLRNGIILTRLTQTAVQKATPLNTSTDFTTAVPTYEIASLLHVDTNPVLCQTNTYTLRVTNLSLVAPVVTSGTATTTAQIGSIHFVAKPVIAARPLLAEL